MSPVSASVRDGLAGTDWRPLNVQFRSYVDGQSELDSLGLSAHYTAADLPLLLVQETSDDGKAPIISTMRKPAWAAAVVDHIKELRGK